MAGRWSVGTRPGQIEVEVVGQAGDGREAVERTLALKPDVVIRDISMPVMSGLEAAAEIRDEAPDTKVLILTVHDQDEYLFEALRAGASGYVLKGADTADLVRAVITVNRGDVFIYPEMATKLVGEYLKSDGGSAGDEGTSR